VPVPTAIAGQEAVPQAPTRGSVLPPQAMTARTATWLSGDRGDRARTNLGAGADGALLLPPGDGRPEALDLDH